MTDNTGMDDFMSITSGDANLEPEIQQQPTHQRDEAGRFATKVEEPAPAIEPNADALIPQDEPHNQGNIPPARLKAEAEKRREAEADAAALRREIAELRGMVTATRQPAAQPQQEAAPSTIWDDPDGFLKNQLSPVQQQMEDLREMMWEGQAAQLHTAEKLEAAKTAAAALAGTPAGQALHSEIMAGGNPFSNLVKWHERQTTLATVGSDPQAWLKAEIDKLKADPTFQAEVMELARGSISPNTNRSTPLTNIPPSLSRIPSGGNAAMSGDESDGALFSTLTSGRR